MKNKQTRREERRTRNREKQEKHIAEEIARGRVMWENNNGQDFSPSWINSHISTLVEDIKKGVGEGEEHMLTWIRTHRDLIRDIILRWPSPQHPFTPEYYLLKAVLEIYWDQPILNYVEPIKACLQKYAEEKNYPTSS